MNIPGIEMAHPPHADVSTMEEAGADVRWAEEMNGAKAFYAEKLGPALR